MSNPAMEFKKGEDSRRKPNARKGTGKADKFKKLVDEMQKEGTKITYKEMGKKILDRLGIQAMLGDIDSIKLFSKYVPIGIDESSETLQKISNKEITKQGKQLLKSFANREITDSESNTYSNLLTKALENDVVAQLVEQVREIKEGLKK